MLHIYKRGRNIFCKKCGQEVNDEAVVCVHCGCSLKESPADKPEMKESKTGMGVVFGLFLGLIGLIIGICIYPEGSVARKTFLKAWIITFVVSLVISVVLYFVVLNGVLTDLYSLNY